MKEILELRINYKYAELLFEENEGRNLGASVKIIEISQDDPRYREIPIIDKQLKQKYDQPFFFGWEIKRKYTKKELDNSKFFHLVIRNTFEPPGEECGTLFDESNVCKICGSNRKQVGILKLKSNSIPNVDIAKTIAGEVVISGKFATIFKQNELKGAFLKPVMFGNVVSNFYQLVPFIEIDLSQKTVSGINPFDLSTSDTGEIYKCPKGHTIGLNLLSEPYILNDSLIFENDLIVSKEKIGVKRGLLRPTPLFFCSPSFRKLVMVEKLSGLEFEIAHIV